ncbi:MAG: hypothetical protein ACREH3_03130, partial [Geminicoccales bacterium]
MQACRPSRLGADRRVRIRRRLAPLLCLALLAIPAAATGARAEPDQITVRTGRHEGFGRIVFDWQAPVEFDAAQQGNRLRLTFARAAVVDLSLLAERLPEVLERASGSDRDGRTLVELTLRPAVRAKVFALTDGRVVVDLPRPTAEDRDAAAAAGSTGAAGAALPGGTVPGPGDTVRGGSEQSQAAPSESAVPPRAAVETEGSGRPELQIRGRLVEGDPVLAFDWDRPVGA